MRRPARLCFAVHGGFLTGLAVAVSTCFAQVLPPDSSAAVRAPRGTVLHVSPAGRDAWSGALAEPNAAGTDGPLATLQAAQERVRALAAAPGGLQAPVTVLLRNGVYRQTRPLAFTAADSGTPDCPVTYAAYPGETPVISGGAPLTGWEPNRDGRGPAGLWSVAVPRTVEGSPWRFNELTVNGQRRTRARTPNRGQFLRTDGPIAKSHRHGFRFHPGDMQAWEPLSEVMVVVYHSWETSIHHVRELDLEANMVTFREPAPWPMGRWERQQRYFIENLFEGLDEPGEWYLDQAAGRLYYLPLPGEDLTGAEVVAPVVVSTLLAIQGDPLQESWVEHLHFRGLSFQHTNAQLRGLRNPGQGEIYQPGLVHAVGWRHSSLVDCEIAHAAAHAIWLAEGCADTRVERCHLHSLGGGGVYIGGGSGVSEAAATGRIRVHNCFIHDGSHRFHGAHGVWIGRSSHNTITHNEIANLDYSGISCGWSWGFQPSTANHNNLDYNYIHHLGNGDGLSDMGAIYTLGVSPGTTVRHNHIHDVYSYAHVSHGSGIYPDEGSSEILIEDNVVYRVRNSPLFMHYGKDCIVRNNILALGGKGQLRRSREDRPCHYIAEGNIVYADIPHMLDGPWKNGDWQLARNLYWSTAGEPLFAGVNLAAWQAQGNDAGSLVADPLFVDPAAGDFRLRPESPALAMGFRPLDVGRCGLQGDPAWVALPQRFANRVRNEIAPPVEPPFIVNFDFEADEVDAEPLDGTAVGGENGASLVVSADTAAAGRHSLRFTDAPGQRHSWTPHLFYRKTYAAGTILASWDMLNSAAAPASFYVELRQYEGGSYRVGPTVSVTPAGQMTASGRDAGTIPLGVWVRIEITMTLEADGPPTYQLLVQVPGREAQAMELPVADAAFRRIDWLGISSTSDDASVFHIDTVRMGTADDLAKPPARRPPSRQQARRPRPPANADLLMGHWTFEEGDTYTVRDVSGNGNHADAWARRAKGAFGTALLCEASGSDVTVADDSTLHFGTSDFAIALWVCPARLGIESTDRRRRVLSKSDYPRTWWVLDISSEGHPVIEMVDANRSSSRVRVEGAIAENAWAHLVLVVERGNRRASWYRDGVLDSTAALPESFTGSLDVAEQDLSIGSRWQPYIGLIDDVRIYRRALAPAEIRTIWEQTRAGRDSTAYGIVE